MTKHIHPCGFCGVIECDGDCAEAEKEGYRMTDRSKLLALAEAVEKLTGPDAEIDSEIWRVVFRRQDGEDPALDPEYTASLDAAMTLVPEGFNDWSLEGEGGQWVADFSAFGAEGEANWHLYVRAATPAAAFCGASLRAQAEALA